MATARRIETFEKLGVSELIFDFRAEVVSQSLERMHRFAEALGLKGVPA